jgi:hypothetical protein
MSDDGGPAIDRDKVRAQARKLDGTGLRVWLDRAIDMLPDEAFPALIEDYVWLKDILVDEGSPPDLLQTIRHFHRESLAGKYYQEFNVNSRNFMEKSRGTELFIAEHTRLLDACMKADRQGDAEVVREGLRLLLDLMRQIDECRDDIIFFADEAGSWQVGVQWEKVLPVWFRRLAPGADPYDWAEAVIDALNAFAGPDLEALLEAAREIASPEQREALSDYECNLWRRR